MRRKGWDKDIIFLLVATLLFVLSWVGFEIYRAYTKVELPTDVEKHFQELNPSLNMKVFDRLEEKKPLEAAPQP